MTTHPHHTFRPPPWRRISCSLFLVAPAIVAAAAVASSVTIVLPPTTFHNSTANAAKQTRTLTFVERVAYQRAIEEVYWRHRIWPKERPEPKPSLDAVMSHVQLQKKVADYLRNSQALEDYWRQPITVEQYRLR